MVCELLAERSRTTFAHEKFEARIAQATVGGEKVLLLQPQTFMNASGRSLGAAARFYKVEPPDVLVIHDELDLPFGKLQLKTGGGTGGHNGLVSMLESWGEQSFGRLRFGIDGQATRARTPKSASSGTCWATSRSAELGAASACPAARGSRDGSSRAGRAKAMQKAMNRFNRSHQGVEQRSLTLAGGRVNPSPHAHLVESRCGQARRHHPHSVSQFHEGLRSGPHLSRAAGADAADLADRYEARGRPHHA